MEGGGGRILGGGGPRILRITPPPALLLRVEIHPSGGAADICVEDLAEFGTCPAAEAPRSDSSSSSSPRIQAANLPPKTTRFSVFYSLKSTLTCFFTLRDFFFSFLVV